MLVVVAQVEQPIQVMAAMVVVQVAAEMVVLEWLYCPYQLLRILE